MTAQIPDRVIYQNERYDIVGQKGDDLFAPHEFGLLPQMIHTACWRGYHCDYRIREGQLWLSRLVIRTATNTYPPLGGVAPILPLDYVPGLTEAEQAERLSQGAQPQSAVYTGLALPTRFSGGLLIAKDFIEEMYVHMGFQKPTSFRTVLEILVEDGRILSITDYSNEMAARREALLKPHPSVDPQPKQAQRREWPFSLDYDR